MRIIRGRDYYDNAQAYGRDNSVVFVREKDHCATDDEIGGLTGLRFLEPNVGFRQLDGKPVHRLRDIEYVFKKFRFQFGQVTVIFCGKVYHGMGAESDGTWVYHWDKARFVEWMAGLGIEIMVNRWERRPFDLDAFFMPYDAPRALLDWLILNRVVVAIRFPTSDRARARSLLTWSINADRLKEVQFYRVFDAFAAFQEIAMWIGGVLPSSGNPMVEIADAVRLEKHGFSKTISFRNMNRF